MWNYRVIYAGWRPMTRDWMSTEYILEQLAKLPFVRWDRFVHAGEYGKHFYGWIEREDSHEDFVFVVFLPTAMWYTTSSARYSKEISERLLGLLENSGHEDCQRIENLPGAEKLSNVIRLENHEK